MENPVTKQIKSHISIRSFKADPIPTQILDEILECGLRASSSGNMQTWSVIATTDAKLRQELYVAHLNQDMVLQAPMVLTFCADFNRMSRWLKLREARPSFDDLGGFMTALMDAALSAQNMAIAAESFGLGLCYMGTTLYSCDQVSKILNLPELVFPITSYVMGYANESVSPRGRLPKQAIIHHETYRTDTDDQLLEFYREREIEGVKRYQRTPRLKASYERSGAKNLAQFYTSDEKYSKSEYVQMSKTILELLKNKGFWNF